MKKRDLFLAGALLLGMSVQAQEQLFFYGFEADETSLLGPDSLKIPVDSVKQLQYYKNEGTSTGTFTLDETWELWEEPVDTALYMINGISPLTTRGDVVNVVEADEQHAIEFEGIGGKGGEYYLTYKADTVGGATTNCNDYEANIFVRGLPIKDNTSYRLSYYVKADKPEGYLQTDVMRGWYNSEKAFSMTGASGNEFIGTKESFQTERWERVTMMTYYQNDSVANQHMYAAGYWWGAWARTFEDGKSYQYIVQPDTYFARFSFRGPGVTYYVDDIALTESWIAGAEYNGQILRVDFGYDTNLAEIAKASPLKSEKLPYEYFDLVGYYYDGEELVEEELPIYGAEYHEDGYLYIWLDGDVTFEGLDSVGMNFRNPSAETGLQLKYDGSLYPMALDTNWVNAGKVVPNFFSEPAFYNPEITATSQDMMPPLVVSVEPEAGSFTLDANTREIKVTFNKETYAKLNCKDTEEKGVMAKLSTSGVDEFWIPTAYDEENFVVTFSRQAIYTTPLNGDYSFQVYQMRAVSFGEAGEDYNCVFSFGELGDAPKFQAKLDFAGYNKGVNEIAGLEVNASCMMEVTEFQGAYEKALKFGLYGKNLQNGAPVLTYTFNVLEAGEWYVNYGTSGCLKNSWNDGCKMVVTIVDEAGNEIYSYTEDGTNNKPEEGGQVDTADVQSTLVNFPAAGQYKVLFTLPNENSYGGMHKGGRVLYYFEVCNVQSYSRAFQYIAGFNVALANAQAAIAKAEANVNYTGAALDALKAFVEDNKGFSSTAPSAYSKMNADFATETGKLTNRFDIVDAYYAAYEATKVLVDSMSALEGYKDLAAVATASASLAANKDLNVVPLTDDEIKALTDQFNAETKAINDRCAAIADFNTALATALETIEDNAGTTFAEFVEYKSLQAAYNANKDLAVYSVADEDLAAATKALKEAAGNFTSVMSAVSTLTKQVKDLKELAEGLEVVWGAIDAQELAAQVTAETEDNQKLANVYKLAIKAQLEAMMAGGSFEEIAPLSMGSFIQNTQLYTGIKGYSTPDYQGNPHNGANAVKYSDQKTAEDKAKFLPGWTVEAAGGNVYTYNHAVSAIASEAEIAIDWNSNITMSQELTNLPAGVYSFEIAYKADDASSLTGEVVFIQEGVDTTYTDTLSMAEGADKFVQFNYYGGNLKVKARFNNTSTWSYYDALDGLSLVEPLADFDYAAAAAVSQAALSEAYTSVNAIVTPSKVEFYNLNGMQVTEPNKGVNIRISTGANGQRVIEKVLVK